MRINFIKLLKSFIFPTNRVKNFPEMPCFMDRRQWNIHLKSSKFYHNYRIFIFLLIITERDLEIFCKLNALISFKFNYLKSGKCFSSRI